MTIRLNKVPAGACLWLIFLHPMFLGGPILDWLFSPRNPNGLYYIFAWFVGAMIELAVVGSMVAPILFVLW
jgi:hypothetical protein